MTIYRKLMLGFGMIMLLMILANIYVLLELNSVSEATQVTLSSDVRAIDLAKQLQAFLYDEERYADKFVISRDRTYYRLYTEQRDRFEEVADSIVTTLTDSTEMAQLVRVRQEHTWFAANMEREVDNQSTDPLGERSLNENGRLDTLEAMHSGLDNLIRHNQLSISSAMSSIAATTIRSSNVAYLLTVGALLAALTVALIITHTITKPIGTLIEGTDQIARGIFDPITVSSRDEIAVLTDAVNDMSSRLKEIDELKTELMHHLSHELRTPLQAMLSAQYLLVEQRVGPLNDEQLRLLASIKEGINKLSRFSNQFLDISKIEAGRMEYHFVTADLLSLVNPAVDEAKLIAARKRITLKMSTTPVPKIKADPEKVSQIISNLLSNAIKYTGEGGTISVNVEPCKLGARVSVQDSGVGIAPEDLPRVFIKFYQAKNAGRASSKGTGVGLALVKALTEGHGGKVYAESNQGIGSTFTVELPRATTRPEEEIVSEVVESGEKQA